MKRHHFTTIDQVREAHSLLKKSVRVAVRKDGFYRKELFQLEDCYLEVCKHSHFNVIIKVSRFEDPRFLEPYLATIRIDHLFLS